jgi:hypothetical protein
MQVSAIFTSRPRLALAHSHARTIIAMNDGCCSEGRNPSVLSLCPAELDGHVLPLDLSGLAQPLEECGLRPARSKGRINYGHCRLVRPRRERPHRCATEPCDKLAPPDQSCLQPLYGSSLPQPQVSEQGASGLGAKFLRYFFAAREAAIVQILWGERRGDYIHRRGCTPNDGASPCHGSVAPVVRFWCWSRPPCRQRASFSRRAGTSLGSASPNGFSPR